MANSADISSILAALAQRSGQNQAQSQPQPQQNLQQAGVPSIYPNAFASPTPPNPLGGFPLPQPTNSGSLDLSSIKPVNSGTVSIAEAIAKARGYAAEKGISEGRGRGGTPNRDDTRTRGYRRSQSRSPPPRRDNYRDNYNPYRDERRDDRRGGNSHRDYGRERSYSPVSRDRRGGNSHDSSNTGYRGRDRSPARGSADENVEIIQIDSSLVGLIIGRQGENLRRVEQDSGARVQFITGPDVSGPKRDCKISGPLRARMDAKKEIQRIIEENGRGTGNSSLGLSSTPNFAQSNSGSQQASARESEDTTQIMVPDRTVGLIIGRGGETIRDLQERSGCHVNIVGEQKSVNGLRPVNLIGSPQAAAIAKNLIMEIVDSDNKSLASGSGTGTSSRDQGMFGAGGGGAGVGMGGKGPGNERTNDSIVVPSSAVGMIIGKGGDTIKDMQNQSGCKINVSPQTNPNETDREIGLVGSRDAIEHAKRLIEDKVDIVAGGRSGGRDNHNSNDYRDTYQQQKQNQQSYQAPTTALSGDPGQASNTGNSADPYAAYGGYQNYVAMWSWAMQQQQAGQGQATAPGQPQAPGSGQS